MNDLLYMKIKSMMSYSYDTLKSFFFISSGNDNKHKGFYINILEDVRHM